MFLNIFSRSFKRRELTKSDVNKYRKKYRFLLDCWTQVLGLSKICVGEDWGKVYNIKVALKWGVE